MKKIFTAMLAVALALSFGVAEVGAQATPTNTGTNVQTQTVLIGASGASGMVLVADSIYGTSPNSKFFYVDPSKPFWVFFDFDTSTASSVAYAAADSFAVDLYSTCENLTTKETPGVLGETVHKICTFTSQGLDVSSAYLINPSASTFLSKRSRSLSGTKNGGQFCFVPPSIYTAGQGAIDSTAAAVLHGQWLRRNYVAEMNFCPKFFFHVYEATADLTWIQNIFGKLNITVVQ